MTAQPKRITDIGPPHYEKFLPPVIKKNYGLWKYHENIAPGIYCHVSETGDRIYLSSDGLVDQHSPSRERFGSRRLVRFLNEHKELPMEVQKQKLEEEMIGFMKTEKQRDDITILSIKL